MFQQETAVLELFTRERVASDLGLLNIFNETYTTTLSARDNWIVEQADMLSQSATSTPFTRVIASSNNDVRVGTSIEWGIVLFGMISILTGNLKKSSMSLCLHWRLAWVYRVQLITIDS